MDRTSATEYFEFFPEELIPVGLQIVLDSWYKIKRPSANELEDKITKRLVVEIKRDKKARRMPFTIDFQHVPIGPSGVVPARIDFKFLSGYDEDAYLAFECKRLNIPRAKSLDSNVGSYTGSEGMGRFISGKYSLSQKHGAMVGYVMDGNATTAKGRVLKHISTKKVELGLLSWKAWEKSQFLPHREEICQTKHKTKQLSNFTLQHIFFSA